MIIGLTGGIGHGKTTFARYLEQAAGDFLHYESSDLVIDVANALRQTNHSSPVASDLLAVNQWLQPLPEILAATVHLVPTIEPVEITPALLVEAPEDYDKLSAYLSDMIDHPERQFSVINAQTKTDFRPLLQWLGGYLVKQRDGIWFDELVRRLQTRPDVELITVSGLRYPGDAERVRAAGGLILEIARPNIVETDKMDITERERDLIEPDIIVNNNGTLKQLEHCATALQRDLTAVNVKATYQASDY